MSFSRAASFSVETARLPLEEAIELRATGGGAGDISTLAVVQLLLLRREYAAGGWGGAISRCPALQCAPLRKYVRWKAPYTHLNDAARPGVSTFLPGWTARGAEDCSSTRTATEAAAGQMAAGAATEPKPKRECGLCGKPGHVAERCYQAHPELRRGSPEWHAAAAAKALLPR